MKQISILCLAVLIFASCKKSVSNLPDATQTGANTFGAKVDGQFWVPEGFGPFNADNLLESELVNDRLFIKAQNFSKSPNETEFNLAVVNVTGPGTYLLNGGASYGYYVKRNFSPLDEWTTTSTNTGAVVLTKVDTANHIVSGTFYFSASSIYDPANILNVTEGRFDVKY